MSPRIIAGSARGRRVHVDTDSAIRPTSDRVREALFSILGDRVPGNSFLDLFAGSGINGLEALSRGAASATFIDESRKGLDRIRQAADAFGFGSRAAFQALSLPSGLPRVAPPPSGGFAVVFADPPYRFAEYASLLEGIENKELVATGGMVVIEHSSKALLPESIGVLQRLRTAVYGETSLSFFT